MKEVESRLKDWARERGYLVAVGPRRAVDEALDDLQRRKDAGEFDPAFFEKRLGWIPRDASTGALSSAGMRGDVPERAASGGHGPPSAAGAPQAAGGQPWGW